MSRLHRRLLRSLAFRMGYDVQKVRSGAWLLQRRGTRDPLTAHPIGSAKSGPVLLAHHDKRGRTSKAHRAALDQEMADEHLAWVLDKLRIDCVLDVGANVGQFAQRLRALGYTGQIVSFEPVPALLAELRAVAADDARWRVLPYALGEEDGTAEINVVPGTMSSLLEPSEFGRSWATKLRDTSTATVQVRRLDSVLDEATAGLSRPRILLKLDTQGFDLQAFRGAGDRLTEVLALQSELACVPIYDGMPRLPEQLSEYESAGFAISATFPVSRHRKSMRLIELDVLMVRSDPTEGS